MSQVLVLIDREEARRRQVGTALSEFYYEVVPALDAREGLRFARSVAAPVIVAVDRAVEADRPTLEALFEHAAATGTHLTLLVTAGADGADRYEAALGEVPDHVQLVPVGELGGEDLVARLRVLLLGRQLALAPDFEMRALVGDFSEVPLSVLLPRLGKSGITGTLEAAGGRVEIQRGEVWAARCGEAKGTKAFSRLAVAWTDGLFHLSTAAPRGEREIDADPVALLIMAVEDAQSEELNRRARVSLNVGRALFDTSLAPLQREILAAVGKGTPVGHILDRLPARDGEILREIAALRERGVVELGSVEPAVTVITDSAADLPGELLRGHGIQMVPLTLRFGQRTFRDRVDLTPADFYPMLASEREPPSTQPPAPEDFAEAYGRLPGRSGAVSIHLSGKMSQTLAHAREGAERAGAAGGGAAEVVVVDGEQVSVPLGLLCLFAARMAARGLTARQVATRIESQRSRVHSLFVVDTLEYLARGGRIGRARAVLGGLLRIKPILGVVDGEVTAIDRARGGRAAQLKIVELFKAKVDVARPVVLLVAHAAAPVWAERLRNLLSAAFQVSELIATEMGPVVGTHAGPGTVGAALFQAESGEEAELTAPLAG